MIGSRLVEFARVRAHVEAFVRRLPGGVEVATIGGCGSFDFDVRDWARDQGHETVISFELDQAVEYVKGQHLIAFRTRHYDQRMAAVLAHARRQRDWYWRKKQRQMNHKISITIIDVRV